MQLLTGSDKNLSAEDVTELSDFMEKQLGFVGITIRQVNGDWVIAAEGRGEAPARTHKAKCSVPSDPADID